MITRSNNFTRSVWLTLGTLMLFFLTVALYSYSELQTKKAHATELTSFVLSDELRQTSDDLTRMARLYVATGNPRYKDYYQEILDIRDGKAPRPVASDEIYWDLVLYDNKRPRPNGQAISLIDLMKKAHFTAEAFEKLSQSKSNSDNLTHIEMAAMKLVESNAGKNRLEAIERLSDTKYLKAKRDIMLPIAAFNGLIRQSTQQTVYKYNALNNRLVILLIILGLLLMYRLFASFRALNTTLGCSADKLRTAIARMGEGDFSTKLPIAPGIKNSVMNWLIDMQHHLLNSEEERKALVAQMHDMAYYDSLTHLPNRRMLDDRLAQALALSKRFSNYGALMFIDLDHFKTLNDTHGHGTGDLLLVEVSKRLTLCLREIDTIARFGGDEFVVMINNLGDNALKARENAALIAEKIRATLAEPYLLMLTSTIFDSSLAFDCSASIGVVLFFEHKKTREELLKMADMAMYESKEGGRNQVRIIGA
jgi:diguanylate cyclase (GGDEF)-like protein